MGLYDTFGTDANLEAGQGITLEYPDCSITIHRAGGANKKYAQAISNKMKPYARKVQLGTMEEALAYRLLVEAYAEAIVIGWEGVTGKDGKPLPFTKENCITLFMDLPDLFADVRGQAENAAAFKVVQEEEDQKN
jgi:hypothetical protein